jgi:WhiB family redox-sensing transcriptional regulator
MTMTDELDVFDQVDWRGQAACRPGSEIDPELFFPEGAPHAVPYRLQVAQAKAVCARCPVLAQCREWALPAQGYGVAGGLDEHERSKIRTRLGLGPVRISVPISPSREETAKAGRAAVRKGVPADEIQQLLGVTPRSVERYQAQVAAEDAARDMAEAAS